MTNSDARGQAGTAPATAHETRDDELDRLRREIIVASRVALAAERDAEDELHRREWLLQVLAALLSERGWWTWLPPRLRRRYRMRRLRRIGLFDAASYLAQNDDLAATRARPLEHFVSHGLMEGRPR